MYILLTVLTIALSCEAMVNIFGTLGFLVIAMAAIFLSCLAENKKRRDLNVINFRQKYMRTINI